MMEGGYNLDPNMLVSALTRDNDGFMGGGNGLLWIFLLILFGGFGGVGGVGRGATGDIEAALAKAQAAGCSDQLILTAIAGNKEAVNSIGSYLGVEVSKVQSAIAGVERGICELGYKTGQDTATIISEVNSGNAALSKQLSDCCCATQRAIDGVNYNVATGFASLQNNMDKSFCALERTVDAKIDAQTMEMRAGFQGIRDYMTAEKIEALQQDLQTAQFALSQGAQTQAIKDYLSTYCGPVVTCPVTK